LVLLFELDGLNELLVLDDGLNVSRFGGVYVERGADAADGLNVCFAATGVKD
jgi:hypothetical protein